METYYSVVVRGALVWRGQDLESAIRTWDAETYAAESITPGGIEVQTYIPDGPMVRDGWVLHVQENGVVYLSPTIGQEG